MLLFMLLPLLVVAFPTKETVYVGQVFQLSLSVKITVSDIDGGALPSWLTYNNNILQGIPTKEDQGKHFVRVYSSGIGAKVIELLVEEDDRNPCGDEDTYWVEAIFKHDGKVEKKLKAAMEVSKALNVTPQDLRVFSFKYSRSIRRVESIGGDADGAFTIIKKVACGDDMETAADELDIFIDNANDVDYENAVITKGRVLPRKQRHQGVDILSEMSFSTNDPEISEEVFTTTTEGSTRTTRRVDNTPIKLNSLSGFQCIRGVYCEMTVPEMTFKDAEDGDTFKLKLSVQPLIRNESWIFYEHRKLKGVPLEKGEFEFRLEARDKAGQMVSAPFKVVVRPSSPSNHLIFLELETPSFDKIIARPTLLAAFVQQLSSALQSKPADITIRELMTNGTRTVVVWSNNTVPHKTCSYSAIDTIRHSMLTKQRAQTKLEFIRAMGSQFHVRKASMELKGNCLQKDDDLVTMAPSVEATRDSSFPWIVLVGVLVLVLVLVILILAVCSAMRKNKKDKPSEYMGKGMPVVFPEEVGEDHEMANATTPMLTKEERPPLKVSQHENPLYKPPPPLAAASPRVGSTSNSLPNQRMPPPYIPP